MLDKRKTTVNVNGGLNTPQGLKRACVACGVKSGFEVVCKRTDGSTAQSTKWLGEGIRRHRSDPVDAICRPGAESLPLRRTW